MILLARTMALGVLAALAVGCQNPINLRNAQSYYDAGLTASGRGDYFQAAALYSRSISNAEIGRAPAAGKAMAYYGYGRTLCLLGEFEEGVEALETSLELQREVEPESVPELLRRTSVLGRIHLDTGDHAAAVPYFREANELVSTPGAGRIAPGDRLSLLRDYRVAAEAGADDDERARIDEEIALIVSEHGESPRAYDYERFTPEAVAERRAADMSPEEFRRK
ncbi:MAG: tetratricopeptide repeat protein [Planctomycetota bacterium]